MDSDLLGMIKSALDGINAKLLRHDEKFDDLTNAVQNIIKIDVEIKDTKEALGRAFKKLADIEREHKEGGCSHVQREIKRIDAIDARIKILENKPLENMGLIKKGFLGALGAGLYTWFIVHFIKG
jgi:hypothetical protein